MKHQIKLKQTSSKDYSYSLLSVLPKISVIHYFPARKNSELVELYKKLWK